MKATDVIQAQQPSTGTPEQTGSSSSGWVRYVVAGALLLLAYTAFGWTPANPEDLPQAGPSISSGFAAFWLVGAVVTLIVVAISGRKN